MNPLRFRATNYATFPSIDWEIPEGVTAVIGNNGAGKSTLLNGILLALFADGARDLAPALGPFSERLEIELEFEHDGERYRVRRSFAKSKATLDFEIALIHNEDETVYVWDPLNRESVRETQALIEQTLGLNRATFNASAFLAQGNSAAFCEAAPSERKATLGQILDPRELWPRLALRALAERKITETELQINQTKIDERAPIAERVPELYRVFDQAGIAAQQADAQHNLAARVLEQALADQAANETAAERTRAARAVRDAAFVALGRAQMDEKNAQAAKENLAQAEVALVTLAQRAVEIPTFERQAEDERTADLRADTARREKNTIEVKIADLQRDLDQKTRASARLADEIADYEDVETPHCARCDQPLDQEARETAIRNARGDISALDDGTRVITAELEKARIALAAIEIPVLVTTNVEALLVSARQAAQEHAGVAERIRSYETLAAQLPAHTQALRVAKEELAVATGNLVDAEAAQTDPERLAAAVASARLAASNRRVDLDEANAALHRAEAELERAKTAALELAELANSGALIHQRLDLLRLAERATGRDGIPALIAENAAGVIEAEANRVLERLPTSSGSTFRIELRTQKTLKSDAGAIRETLDILVSDRQSTREFATFSGGERFRVAFALRWSLARLLAGRRGAESRLLVIDEPDGLDAGGMDGLAAVLREERGGFDRILVVSHNPLLASSFEQVLEISSDGEVSRIEEDSLMGVAA